MRRGRSTTEPHTGNLEFLIAFAGLGATTLTIMSGFDSLRLTKTNPKLLFCRDSVVSVLSCACQVSGLLFV